MDVLSLTLAFILIVMLMFVSALLILAMTVLMKVYKFVAGLLGPIFNLFKSPW